MILCMSKTVIFLTELYEANTEFMILLEIELHLIIMIGEKILIYLGGNNHDGNTNTTFLWSM